MKQCQELSDNFKIFFYKQDITDHMFMLQDSNLTNIGIKITNHFIYCIHPKSTFNTFEIRFYPHLQKHDFHQTFNKNS